MQAIETPKTCAACGEPINQSMAGGREFCSDECVKAGRAFCKHCGEVLVQPSRKGPRKVFCNTLCASRYHRHGVLTPTLIEEYNRTECLVCGNPITQGLRAKKKFCSPHCANKYRRTGYDKRAYDAEWGQYASETRKCLLEVQHLMGIRMAKRLATAIDREYVLNSYQQRIRKEELVRNKTRTWTSLTWDQVDQIRKLYAEGELSSEKIGERFGIYRSSVMDIVYNRTWKPENDPRREQRDASKYLMKRGGGISMILSHNYYVVRLRKDLVFQNPLSVLSSEAKPGNPKTTHAAKPLDNPGRVEYACIESSESFQNIVNIYREGLTCL